MTRKELYAEIKSLGLENEVKSRTGKNFTNVSTGILEIIVKEAHEVLEAARKNECKCKKSKKAKTNKEKESACIDWTPVVRLIEVLAKKHILLMSEVEYIVGTL